MSLHEWVTVEGSDGPVADWNTNMVQASRGDLVEVVLGYPGVPVLRETGGRFCFAES